jgi:fructokinase
MVPERLGREIKAIHLGTLGLVLEPMATTLVELVRREHDGRVVMIDPNIRLGLASEGEYRDRLQEMISHSAIVKASDADLAWLYPGMSYEDAADRILGEGARLVVVTLGAQGAFAAHRGFHVAVDAVKVVVVDTIGAGDAFGAALLAWLHDHDKIQPDLDLEKGEVKSALEFACLAAALTCARAGADPPWKSEMIARASR